MALLGAPYDRAYEKEIVERMNQGIDAFLDEYREKVLFERPRFWGRDFSSVDAYERSVASNRARLRELLGIVDERMPFRIERRSRVGSGRYLATTEGCVVERVRWDVLEGMSGEGLLLTPRGPVTGYLAMLPDADQTPESFVSSAGGSIAIALAESGVQVAVPLLIDRGSAFSGRAEVVPPQPWREGEGTRTLFTDMSHRDWIYRQAYTMGRHVIGYEIQKVLALVDWFDSQSVNGPIGVAGYGEGGLLALYASAVDTRIDAAWVSGYFGSREELWREPIYRNVWGFSRRFGDAEVASLIVPRRLVVEACPGPEPRQSSASHAKRVEAAVGGQIPSPTAFEAACELDRLNSFFPDEAMVSPNALRFEAEAAWSPPFAGSLGELYGASVVRMESRLEIPASTEASSMRQKRQISEMVEFTQRLIRTSDHARYQFLRGDMSSPEAWDASMEPYRERFYEELVGRIDEPLLPLEARTRVVFDEDEWIGEEVALDVFPNVFAWGILARPKGLKPRERRPVVVMQHGIGGFPTTPLLTESYNEILLDLLDAGFVVFAPRNPYRFNVRKALPLKASVFSLIVPQHQQILNYLNTLDFVDSKRISFYGKSWGGRSALYIPALEPRYRASICSAYYNDWPRKAATPEFRNSYLYTGSIGVYQFNMGSTFCHFEMAALTAPRPFMVEAGYLDGVAAHEMVAYEFAKLSRLYAMLGIPDQVELAFFVGGHEINAAKAIPFLRKRLEWLPAKTAELK